VNVRARGPVRTVLTLAILVLASTLFYEIFDAIRSHIAARWKSTPGRLKRWNLYYDVGGEDTNIVIRDFAYVYSVAGKDYESSRIGFGFPTWMSVLYLEKTLKRLLKSAPEVIVFFDPANPQRSVLSVGIQLHHLVKVLALGFVTAVVLSFWYAEP
jgi:hypothetical protein